MPSSDGNGASAQRYISYGPRIARIFPIPALSPHAMMPAAFLPPTPTTSFLSGSRTGLAGDRTRGFRFDSYFASNENFVLISSVGAVYDRPGSRSETSRAVIDRPYRNWDIKG